MFFFTKFGLKTILQKVFSIAYKSGLHLPKDLLGLDAESMQAWVIWKCSKF